MFSVRTVCISLLDVNDNKPRIEFIEGALPVHPGQFDLISPAEVFDKKIVRFSVRERPNACVMVVKASDRDLGANAKLSYDFDLQDEDGLGLSSRSKNGLLLHKQQFRMDPETGEMVLAQNLHSGYLGNYSLLVIVKDAGSPQQTTRETVILELTDNAPQANNLCRNAFASRTGVNSLIDSRNIVIVIVLSAVSAFLAAVLISAIMCMLKPCGKGCKAVRTNGARFHQLDQSGVFMHADEPTYISSTRNGILMSPDKVIGIDPSEVGIPISTHGSENIYGGSLPPDTTYRMEVIGDASAWVCKVKLRIVLFQFVEIATSTGTPTQMSLLNTGTYRPSVDGVVSANRQSGSMEEQRSDSGRGASDEETQHQQMQLNSSTCNAQGWWI
ncbi:hypothetical protein Ciccas_000359 [Cichlidogyrus casuarinus]|uniref:Cadherin domain-containing protein n=1 Tax=Cichlidogyrus casuarinus TaxID=1844966 RepID=A0ABD2QN79_9PLAT